MKKVICFSLWGNQPRYTGGMIHNIELAKIFYPDWIVRIYLGQDVEKEIVELFISDNVEIIKMDNDCNWTGMFWRFLAASDPTVDVMLSRDADSRLHHREKAAVDEWLLSDKQFHIMRDHPYHGVAILGGMWGVKKGLLNDINKQIDFYQKGDFLGVDQNFLGECIYPIVRDCAMVHDEFFEKKPFPKESGERNSSHFVGQAYKGDGCVLDVPEVFIQEYLKIDLKKYEQD